MNKNIKLAVAGAVLALSASAANAGIVIPAGEWTLDISGNVNYYTSWTKNSRGSNNTITGGLVNPDGNDVQGSTNTMGNGLLPNFLSVSGSTRQNDLDVTFLISIQPGSASNAALRQVAGGGTSSNQNAGGMNNRQAFITFGDKSWGSIKMGKDLGIFASDAILGDMTLLGVGAGSAGSAGNTSLGRIGAGYIYADWKPQIAYTTPNFNGLQATVGISKAFDSLANGSGADYGNAGVANANVAYEGKASYSFAANDITGKVWVSGIAQHVGKIYPGSSATNDDPTAYAADIGINAKMSGFDLTGYYYSGSGIGTTGQMLQGYSRDAGSKWTARDSDGGYVQAIYTLPTKTRLGVSWGVSNLDLTGNELSNNNNIVKSNELWTAMVMHPLTKHLTLVAEYDNLQAENHYGDKNTANTGSLGAILFF